MKNSLSTAYSRPDKNSLSRTVKRAGSAFHTSIIIPDHSFAILESKNPVRAYSQAIAASYT
jgi:hypothetical protein